MTPGEVDLIGVGCSVFDCEPDVDPDTPIRGGIVWAIDSTVDPDTGEVIKAFDTVEPWRGTVRFLTISAADVRQWRPASGASVRYVVERMARQVSRNNSRSFDSDIHQMITAMGRLRDVA